MSTRPTRRIAALAAAVAAGALLLAACSGTANSSKPSASASNTPKYTLTANTPAPKGQLDSFTWSLYAEPFSLDYAYAFDYPPNEVLSNVCESLMRWNADLTISPGLATGYTNPSPTTYVFTIRQGVKFHDGSTMTPADVVASLKRHLDPNVGSYWSAVFANVKSIEATGSNDVTVTLTKPDALFPQYMAVSPGTIESAATIKADGKNYGTPSKGVNCTGPFAFKSWTPGQNITLSKFAGYWDSALTAKSNEVQFVFLQDPNTRANAWISGQVDGGWNVPSNTFAQLKSSGVGSLYFGINTSVASEIVSNLKGVLGNVDVRRALEMAIDRQGIVNAGEFGYAEVTNSLVTKNNWVGVPESQVNSSYNKLPKYEYNLTAAKALAKRAGVNGQTITIGTSPITSTATVLSGAVAAAASAIGLKPKIVTISADKYTALFSDPAARKGLDLFYTNWYTSIADPQDMYAILRTGQFSNYGNWSNSSFDKASEIATGSSNATARTAASFVDQQIAADQLPWLPLYAAPTSVWLGSKITGVQPSINYLYYPWAAEIGSTS